MASRAYRGDPRAILARLRALLDARPDFVSRYEEVKRVVRTFRKPAAVERHA